MRPPVSTRVASGCVSPIGKGQFELIVFRACRAIPNWMAVLESSRYLRKGVHELWKFDLGEYDAALL